MYQEEMMILIKAVTIHEMESCAEVIRKSFQTVAVDFGITLENNPSNGAFITGDRLLQDYGKGIMMFGLFDKRQLVGFVAIERKDDDIYYVEKLAVLPERRHEGLGRQLLDFAKEKVKDLGGKRISIAIIEQNIRLKNWYHMNGFVSVGTQQFPHLNFIVGFMEYSID